MLDARRDAGSRTIGKLNNEGSFNVVLSARRHPKGVYFGK